MEDIAWIEDYDNWLEWVFNLPEDKQFAHFDRPETHSPWSRTIEEARRVIRIYEDPSILDRFSANQIGDAFWDVEHLHPYCDGRLPSDVRRQAFGALPNLFKRLFEPRCSHCLGHLSESTPGSDKLDGICYMWWDSSYFYAKNSWVTEDDINDYFQTIDFCLASPKASLQESALHGLGENAYHRNVKDRIQSTIDAYLASGRVARKELVSYARRARSGNVL